MENAGELAGPFLEAIRKKYEGTRLGRQEIDAEILDDNPGALWKRALIDAARVEPLPTALARRDLLGSGDHQRRHQRRARHSGGRSGDVQLPGQARPATASCWRIAAPS